VLVAAAVLAACGHSGPEPQPSISVSPPAPDPGRKVMIIAEENRGYDQIIGNSRAPYLNRLATDYGTALHYDAGYPARCPSLAAYILMTSGTTDGICDDNDPEAHPLSGDNLFHQISTSGRQWRDYAEASPGTCVLAGHGRYLVRHVPATYYRDERADCRHWAVPLGKVGSGALHDDVTAGHLPALAFVSPDACDDMHGAAGCGRDLIAAGDRWLRSWLPKIMAGPDYRAGRLTIIVTWDEGTSTSNHIPALVVAPGVRHIGATQPLTHCSTLRFAEEQLRLPLLGCAAGALSLGAPFGL
jgi:phosphatidylinositol-3-phosphatase